MSSVLATSRLLAALCAALACSGVALAETQPSAVYIVQSATLDDARLQVQRVGATPEREFEVIHAVAARLTAEQAARLRGTAGVRVFDDREIKTRGTSP